MTEQVTAEVIVTNPSLTDSQEEQTAPIPQAETVIRAAVETGKAAQAAESAAREAKESQSAAEQILAEIRPTLEAITERLEALEAEEETEEETEAEPLIIPAEEGDTLTTVSAQTVTLDEPPKPKESIQTKQLETPQEGKRGGGLFKRMFLNQ